MPTNLQKPKKHHKVANSTALAIAAPNPGDENTLSLPHSRAQETFIKHKGVPTLGSLRKQFGFSWKKWSRKVGLFALFVGIFLLVGISLIASWVSVQWSQAKEPGDILSKQSNQSSIVYARDGKTELFKFFDKENRQTIDTMEQDLPNPRDPNQNYIPEKMQLAVLALEDENFYKNDDGIPWTNILGAAFKCTTSGLEDCRGASGISQQLIKNVTQDDESTVDRKIRELFSAIKLGNDKEKYSKSKILNLYLNTVGFGRNANGVQAAAKSYFGKDIKDVTTTQACFLAALPQDPITYNASLNNRDGEDFKLFEKRKNTCLEYLSTKNIRVNQGTFITQDEAKQYEQEDVWSQVIDYKRERLFPHFLDFVESELESKKLLSPTPQGTQEALATGGYRIVTTIDPDIQKKAEDIFQKDRKSAVTNSGANNAAGLILDGPTGEIISMVGSIDYNDKAIDGQVNITTSPQPPGSSFKPYVYASAFEKGFNPATILTDVKTDFGGGYSPNNFTRGQFLGPVAIRGALQNSLNIPAIKGLYLAAGTGDTPDGNAGVKEVMNFAQRAGVYFPSPETCTVSMAIGACDVTMISHATGMNTFAQSGKLRTATPFISITHTDPITGQTRDIYKERMNGDKNQVPYPQNDQAIDPAIANQMANVLSDYEARKFGFGSLAYRLELPGWRVAAKSGTATSTLPNGTEYASDLWLAGYSPLYTVTTWVGNTRNEPTSDTSTGTNGPGIIWNDLMVMVHDKKQRVDFPTTGLTPHPVDCSLNRIPNGCKSTELLTDKQWKALQDIKDKLTKVDYIPKNNTIFLNRNEAFVRDMMVNKADKKIPLPGTAETLLEKLTCVESLSAFPTQPNWFGPVSGITYSSPPQCPTDISSYTTANSTIDITTNATAGSFAPANLVITANSPLASISNISLKLNGLPVSGTFGGNTFSFNSTSETGIKSILIEVQDTLGNTNSKTLDNINFSFSSLNNSDLAAIIPDCSPRPVSAGGATSCNFVLPNGKTLPSGFKIYIGNNTTGSICTQFGSTVSCSNVPAAGNAPGSNVQIKGGVTPTGIFAGSIAIN